MNWIATVKERTELYFRIPSFDVDANQNWAYSVEYDKHITKTRSNSEYIMWFSPFYNIKSVQFSSIRLRIFGPDHMDLIIPQMLHPLRSVTGKPSTYVKYHFDARSAEIWSSLASRQATCISMEFWWSDMNWPTWTNTHCVYTYQKDCISKQVYLAFQQNHQNFQKQKYSIKSIAYPI
jgi:hypothetical protein